MSGTTSDPASTAVPAPAVPLEDRGRTTVADVVVGRTAAAAAAEVPHVVGLRRSLVGVELGRTQVRAHADVDGRVAGLVLELAVEYPAPVRSTARAVRSHVSGTVQRLCDLEVDHVDVRVESLPRPTSDTARVV